MLSLLDRAYGPSTSVQDQLMYLSAVRYLQSVSTNEVQVSDKIKNLLAGSKTRLEGLVLLELALQQSPDIFFKGKWLVLVFKILEEPCAKLMKDLACKITSIAIKILARHPTGCDDDIKRCRSFLFPCLLHTVESNCEWKESALECLLICMKYFGRDFETHKDSLLQTVMTCCFHTCSSKTFELYAECFSVLPACMKNRDQEDYQDNWFTQYVTTLKTMLVTLECLTDKSPGVDQWDTIYRQLEEVSIYEVGVTYEDEFANHMQNVRLYVNLCKCLTKMLSSKTLFPVKVPIKITLDVLCLLFNAVNEVPKNEILLSTIVHLHIASLELLEPLILNFSYQMSKYKHILCDVMSSALHASTMSAISGETISPIRHIVWKLLNILLEASSQSSHDIMRNPALIDELLKDISAEDVPAQASGHQSRGKSKKSSSANVGSKMNFMSNNRHIVCIEALKVLENILLGAGSDIPKEILQEIYTKVVSATRTIPPQVVPPFPYDDERCRKNLYSVLLAIAVTSKFDERDMYVYTLSILDNALRDPSSKVNRFGRRANLMCKLLLQPKKPLPLLTSLEHRQKRPDVTNVVHKFSEWSADNPYVANIPPVESTSNVSENVSPRISQTFHNPSDSEMPPNDFVVEVNYNEAATENQCNGDDILELPNSSQCQDDVEESDEDEEEEDEEDEEMNQEMDIQPEHIYIPSTSEMQVLNPVHINPETVHPSAAEHEYEELRPCGKTQANVVENSSKSQQNGARSIVPDEVQPASTQNVANANGIYASEEEEMEEGEEDEEEEEITFPAEKKIPVFSESPSKMPKLEVDNEVKNEPQEEMDQRSRSPTLVEMKADFCFSEVDDVKS